MVCKSYYLYFIVCDIFFALDRLVSCYFVNYIVSKEDISIISQTGLILKRMDLHFFNVILCC